MSSRGLGARILAATLLLSAGCVEPGRDFDWPEGEFALRLLIREGAGGTMSSKVLATSEFRVLGSDERAYLLGLRVADFWAIHPLVDLERVSETRIDPPSAGCEHGYTPIEDRVHGSTPPGAALHAIDLEAQRFVPLDRSERQDVASRIQLHVPFLRRRPELGSRLSSFGADERVTMDRWVFDGQPRFIGTGEPSVGDHEIHDAEGLGPDHALIVHERALFSFPRDATPLETDEGLVALRYDDLPGFEHTDWAFTTFGLTSRTSTDGAVRLVVASKTNNSEPELTRITWLDVVLAPPSIRPVASTTVAGAVTFSTGVVDALGRVMFLVKLDQDDTPRIERQVVLIADREPRLARIVSRESSIFSMVGATPLAEVPHLVAYEDGLVLGTDLLSDRGPGFEARLPPAIGGGPAALDAVSGPVGLLVFAAGEQGDDLWYDFAEDRWTIPRPITG